MISVVIPLYNAECYIEKALESALVQDEVTEIIIVDDGSTDSSLEVAKQFIKPYKHITLYQHKGSANLGRSHTRNLGIKMANNEYIAFLDSDDYYLPGRFKQDADVFKDKTVDGVYNAIGVHFYREATDFEKDTLKLTTLSEALAPEKLFDELLYFRKGHFSLDGLTVKKIALEGIGFFDEELAVGEDIQLILKLSLLYSLVSGQLDKPVCLRGVHDNNIFNKKDVYKNYRIKSYERLLTWAIENSISKRRIDSIFKYMWSLKYLEESQIIDLTLFWLKVSLRNPTLFFSKLSIKYFPLIRLRKRLFKLH